LCSPYEQSELSRFKTKHAHTETQHPHTFRVGARTWPKAEYYGFTTVVNCGPELLFRPSRVQREEEAQWAETSFASMGQKNEAERERERKEKVPKERSKEKAAMKTMQTKICAFTSSTTIINMSISIS